VEARSFGALRLAQSDQLHDDDLKAVNTRQQPDRVRPTPLDEVIVDSNRVRMTLAPASWNVVQFLPARRSR
jgi:alpha-N-arabinofuranosidase